MLVALSALVLGAVAMGASPLFVRLADVGPYASAFWRTFLALPFLAAWAVWECGGAVSLLRQLGAADWRSHAMVSVALSGIFFAGDLFFWHLSILATTVANATFLATTAPVWVALGAFMFLRERIGWRMLAGLCLCLVGGFALIGQSYGFAPQRLPGDLFGVITAIFFGAYMLAIRGARAGVKAGLLAFLSTAITAVILFVIAFMLEPVMLPRSGAGLANLLALALVSQVAGQGLLAVALGSLPATFSSLVIFIEAIAAAAFGWIFLGEALGTLQFMGGILILAGIYIARPRTQPAPGAVP
jgi:drug/metabolite transporter (DMT)-like permease